MNMIPLNNLILIGHFVVTGTCSPANGFSESMWRQQVFIKCMKPPPRQRYQKAPGQVCFHIFIIMFSAFISDLSWLN